MSFANKQTRKNSLASVSICLQAILIWSISIASQYIHFHMSGRFRVMSLKKLYPSQRYIFSYSSSFNFHTFFSVRLDLVQQLDNSIGFTLIRPSFSTETQVNLVLIRRCEAKSWCCYGLQHPGNVHI